MKPLPRLALALPETPDAAQVALAVARDELRGAPTVDIIIIGAIPSGATPLDEARALDGLAAVRAAGGFAALEPQAGEAAVDACRRLLDAGRIDGVVVMAPLPEPRLRLREGARVIDAFPGVALDEVGSRLTAEGVAALLDTARGRLRALGLPAPRIALFDVDGLAALAEGARRARAAGINALGPLPPARAVSQRADALLALTPTQVELPLALQGTGPETGLSLTGPWAWPADPTASSTVLAVRRLLQVVTSQGVLLAAERELAQRPSVSVSKRAERRDHQGKCPYCHRAPTESADGSDRRPGPPVLCAECGTPHHRDCATEHGRCTTLGCNSTRMLRLGVTIPVGRLGSEAPSEHPFETLAGDASLGPSWLRMEAPIDDPDARPTRRRVSLELPTGEIKRGDVLEGYVVVWAPRPFSVRGGAIRLRASLTTRNLSGSHTTTTQPILARQASFVGVAPAGALGRLQDGVVSLFSGKGNGVGIPAGVRRYPFSFRIGDEHPATVTNRQGGVEESVSTRLEASLDTDDAAVLLRVT